MYFSGTASQLPQAPACNGSMSVEIFVSSDGAARATVQALRSDKICNRYLLPIPSRFFIDAVSICRVEK